MTQATITAKADYSRYNVGCMSDLKGLVTRLAHGQLDYGQTEDGIRTDNNLRAAWGALGLIAFADKTFSGGDGEDWETLIGDLLADLMHLSDALGEDFDALVDKAYSHYRPETHGEY